MAHRHNPEEPLGLVGYGTAQPYDEDDEVVGIEVKYDAVDRQEFFTKGSSMLLPPDWKAWERSVYRVSDDAAYWHGAEFLQVIERSDVRAIDPRSNLVFGKRAIKGEFILLLQGVTGDDRLVRNHHSIDGIVRWIDQMQRTWKDYYHDKPAMLLTKSPKAPPTAQGSNWLN
jgi:hypothetical protein